MARFPKTAVAALLASALTLGALAGCASTDDESTTPQALNRQYMSQVNSLMDDLSAELDEFTAAVAEGDVVALKSQSSDAKKIIAELVKIEAPETLSDVREHYVAGCETLSEALDEYVALYAQIDASEDGLDAEEYEESLKVVRDLYDEGIAELKAGDDAATSKEDSATEEEAAE